MSKQLADVICRALIAVVVALRKEYGLPDYHNIVLIVQNSNDLQMPAEYNVAEVKS